MSVFTTFWEVVAQELEQKEKYGPIKNWKKSEIELFLGGFHEKLKSECSKSQEKAKHCGLKKGKDGAYLYQDLSISFDAFRRIIQTRETKEGNPKTREKFAIYLGYDSVRDFLKQNGIEGPMVDAPLEKNKQPLSAKNLSKKSDKSPLSWLIPTLSAIVLALLIVFGQLTKLLSNPIVLAGSALLLFFAIHRLIILSGLIPPLDQMEGSTILKLLLRYGFIIALVTILAGVSLSGLREWKSGQRKERASQLLIEEVITNSTRIDKRLSSVSEAMLNIEPDSFDLDFNKKREKLLPASASQNQGVYHKMLIQNVISSLRQNINAYPINKDYSASLMDNIIQSKVSNDSPFSTYQRQLGEVEWATESLLTALSSAGDTPTADQRILLALQTLHNRSATAHLEGLRLIQQLKTYSPSRINEQLQQLEILEPQSLTSEEVLFKSLEGRLEEMLNIQEEKKKLLEEMKNDRDSRLNTFEEEINQLTKINPDDTWNVVVGKARSLRDFGRTADAVAAFSKYGEMFSKSDPTAKQYSKVGQLFTLVAESMQLKGGVYIYELSKDGAVKKSGLEVGDIIIQIDQEIISDMHIFVDQLKKYQPDDVVQITYLRLDKERKFVKKTTETVNVAGGGGYMPI